ncbi:hypothetical protein EYR38_000430 [Pleurotus pulmonarius]|nr:hypothetical protein EYR38_000430 [Pleurotus pulmonarius]
MLSDPTLTTALSTLKFQIPCSIILLAFVHDFLQYVQEYIPSVFTRPFQNFLTLDDLKSEAAVPVLVPLWKKRVLASLAFLEAAIGLASFSFTILVQNVGESREDLVLLLAWCFIFVRNVSKPLLTTPYASLALSFSLCLAAGLSLAWRIWDFEINYPAVLLDLVHLALSGTFTWIAGTLPMKSHLPGAAVAKPGDSPSADFTCPEDNVSLWSWSTFSFAQPILNLAMKRTLNETDVWSLSPFLKHKNIFEKFLEYKTAHPKHSLLRFLLTSNSLDLILSITLEMWSAVIGFVPAYALQEILALLGENGPEARLKAFYWAVITFLAHLTFAQKDLLKSWHTRRCYERTRGQLFCNLHYKALKRQDVSKQGSHEDDKQSNADLGKILNLMQGDSYAVAQRFWDFSGLFAAPVRLVIALVFLYNVLGWSALSGVVVVLVAYALNYPLLKYSLSISRSSWKASDARMNVVNELLQNIRFLKFYGWENHWSAKAEKARETELMWRVRSYVLNTFIIFIWIWIPSATALVSFLCYTLIAGQPLTVSKAFTSIALFSQLQGAMMAVPSEIMAMLNAYVSMQRIETFLQEGEIPEWASSLTTRESTPESTPSIGITDGIFEWYTSSSDKDGPARFQLGPLNVEFAEGKLTLVVGPTGSGKSAFLAALLGEMRCISGQVHIDKRSHKIAYCGQAPWLEHATIRDNIIFGSTSGFEEERYRAVLEACALTKDLEMFDAGDLTEIGEKGITLSGGQKARVALARAVYSQAKYILLDDPLAAVDMHTAEHLLSACLTGPLIAGRTVILVTHHVRMCLPAASYIVELSKGTVSRQGTVDKFAELGVLKDVVESEDQPFVEEAPPLSEVPDNEADQTQEKTASAKRLNSNSGKLVQEEVRAEGRVNPSTYWFYIRAAGIYCWILTILLMGVQRVVDIGNQVFIAKWGEAYQGSPSILPSIPDIWNRLPPPDVNVKPWLIIYVLISLAGAFTVLLSISLGFYTSLQAARSLFVKLLRRLTRAPARFFDTTPIGRILNRFTSDMRTLDGTIQGSVYGALSGVLTFTSSFVTIVVVVPNFAPVAIFVAWLYIRIAPPYINASRDLRRLESVSLSPAFAGFDELLHGLVHVRAFGMERRYQEGFYRKVDRFQAFDHVYWLVNTWLRWRYDCLGSIVVFTTTLFALWRSVSDGSAAIVIVQAGIFAEASRQLVRVAAQVELDFNSVERIVEYLEVPQEAPAIIEKSRPPAYWPSSDGGIVVEDLVVKYAKFLPDVLRNISFSINPREKIGIVGRTGSGKSTLALSLLRMVEPSGGKIIIDGIDISSIGLEDLRTRVTIVSQDVSLFTGTLRSNLDPLNEHTDQECWDVLERCHIKSIMKPVNGELSLELPIGQEGTLSAGERQLVALARAVLRRTNIVILDEATSQIDNKLDDQIQTTIREELSSALVITIAHRLKTIIDYDRILVLDNGEIVEFAPPRELLASPGSAFREMCKRSADWPILQAGLNGESS